MCEGWLACVRACVCGWRLVQRANVCERKKGAAAAVAVDDGSLGANTHCRWKWLQGVINEMHFII